MADGIINGVQIKGYTKTENIRFETGPGQYFSGTYVYGPTGASIFLREDSNDVSKNANNGAKIDFSRGRVFASNLYHASIYGVPEKKDDISLYDCEDVTVDTENLKATKEKYGIINFDSNGNPILAEDNDTVTVRYTQNGKPNSNMVTLNKGDRVNGQVFDSKLNNTIQK